MDTEEGLVVVIDDERSFQHTNDILYLRSADEAILWFSQAFVQVHYGPTYPIIHQVWFDHDLGEGDDAGKVGKYLAALRDSSVGLILFDQTEFYVHSMNPIGGVHLMNILRDFNPVRTPLPPLE